MKIIKNVAIHLAFVGRAYVALSEPFNKGYVFVVKEIRKDWCQYHGGDKEFKCPFSYLHEREKRCQGIMRYWYNEEPEHNNYKCLCSIYKKFRPALNGEERQYVVTL